MIIFMDLKSIPNLITGLRVIASPLCALLWAEGMAITSIILMAFIALSDGLDGYLARRLQAESRIGRILDPVADKVLVACMSIFVILAGLILMREFLIGALREDAAGQIVIHVSKLAKWKTALQLIGIITTMLLVIIGSVNTIMLLLIWLPIVGITWASAFGYIQAWRLGPTKEQ
jgi:CDP-diacylglycerol--glycerol-3-phosphate 3-phosphatidyltransferase